MNILAGEEGIAVNWTAFLFMSPLAIMGILLVVFAGVIKDMADNSPRYANSIIPHKQSVGMYRAFGVGVIFVALLFGWLTAQPLSSGQRQPLPSTQVAPQ